MDISEQYGKYYEEALLKYIDIPYFQNNPSYIEQWRRYYNFHQDPQILLLMYYKSISTYYHWIYIELAKHFVKIKKAEIAHFILKDAIKSKVYDSKRLEETLSRIPPFDSHYSNSDMRCILQQRNIFALGKTWNTFNDVFFYEKHLDTFSINFEMMKTKAYSMAYGILPDNTGLINLPRYTMEKFTDTICIDKYTLNILEKEALLDTNTLISSDHTVKKTKNIKKDSLDEKITSVCNTSATRFEKVCILKDRTNYDNKENEGNIIYLENHSCSDDQGNDIKNSTNYGEYDIDSISEHEHVLTDKDGNNPNDSYMENKSILSENLMATEASSFNCSPIEHPNDETGAQCISEETPCEGDTSIQIKESSIILSSSPFQNEYGAVETEYRNKKSKFIENDLQNNEFNTGDQYKLSGGGNNAKKLSTVKLETMGVKNFFEHPIVGKLAIHEEIMIDGYIHLVQEVGDGYYLTMKIAKEGDITQTICTKDYCLKMIDPKQANLLQEVEKHEYCFVGNDLFVLFECNRLDSLSRILLSCDFMTASFYLQQILEIIFKFSSENINFYDFTFWINLEFKTLPIFYILGSNNDIGDDRIIQDLEKLFFGFDFDFSNGLKVVSEKNSILLDSAEAKRSILKHKARTLNSI